MSTYLKKQVHQYNSNFFNNKNMAEKARVKKQQLSSDSCVVVKIYRLTAASDRQRGKQLTFAYKKISEKC